MAKPNGTNVSPMKMKLAAVLIGVTNVNLQKASFDREGFCAVRRAWKR